MPEAVPRFDLYLELQVARHASGPVIEAAFRHLVKEVRLEGGPGVADDERLTRLGLAREWLLDPDRRRRYDAARPPTPRARPSSARPVPDERGSSQPARSFGPNAIAVRRFLAELRTLDWDRAIGVWDARSVAEADGYSAARAAADAAARGSRRDAWQLAREAAAIITQGELGESRLTAEVAELLSDAAGAIAVRDLISPRDHELLLRPWTLPAGPPVAAVRTGAIAGVGHAPTSVRAGRRLRRATPILLPGAAGFLAVVALAIGIAALGPSVRGDVADPSGSPGDVAAQASASTPGTASGLLGPPTASVDPGGETAAPSGSPAATSGASSSPAPVPGPTGPEPGPTPTPRLPTPRPGPTQGPGPTPTRTPGPTPTASPSPAPMCVVVDLVGSNTAQASSRWASAGFGGAVTFDPVTPPHYQVAWQSLTAGTSAPCSSGVTVRNQAP